MDVRQLRLRRGGWLGLLLIGMLLLPGAVAQGATAVRGPVIIRPGGATLFQTPDGAALATLATSSVATATGRNAAADWLWVETVGEGNGWLRTADVIAVGVDLLTVVAEDGSPVAAEVEATEAAAPPDETATLRGRVASGTDRLNVRAGPATRYPILARLAPGAEIALVGRTDGGDWLQIEQANGRTGWVASAFVQVEGDAAELPVIAAPPMPTAAPAAAPVAAASPRPTTGTTGTGPGGLLVISTGPGNTFYAYELATGALWPLAAGFDPAISPDGQTVAFVRDGGENGIYLVDIDRVQQTGQNERLIFSGRTRLSSPKWSPDGAWILFTRSDNFYRCYEFGPACIDDLGPLPPGFSLPEGVEQVTRYRYNLARVDRDGANYRDIASLESARAADWHVDGIVYQSAAGLQITDDLPDAENRRVVYDYLKPYYDDPDWQPNGSQIVYVGKEASHYELFTINPDGSGQRALTRPATTLVDEIPSNVAPVWSPDGQWLAFLSNRTASGEAGAWGVWVMNSADGSVQQLPVDLPLTYTYGGEQVLSWGP